jgi:hypothetical protein
MVITNNTTRKLTEAATTVELRVPELAIDIGASSS